MAKYTVYTKDEITGEQAETPAKNLTEVREIILAFIGYGIAQERFVKQHLILGCEATTVTAHTVRYELAAR